MGNNEGTGGLETIFDQPKGVNEYFTLARSFVKELEEVRGNNRFKGRFRRSHSSIQGQCLTFFTIH